MRARIGIGILLAAIASSALVQSASRQIQPQLFGKAPNFSASTADGKTYDLKSLNKSGPVYLVFIKHNCPITADAMHYYTTLYSAYDGKAPLLGIINGDADQFKSYNADHKLPFPTVLDPKQNLVATYKVQSSPTIIEVKADGTIGRTWKGYSQKYLQQIDAALAMANHAPIAKIDFSDAPKDASFG